MRKILSLFVVLCWFQLQAQPNLVKMEYWIDGDPGFGLATEVTGIVENPILTVQNLILLNSENLPAGLHTLGIRTKDADNQWSHTNLLPFLITQPAPQTSLVRIEYFWDGDAGMGENNIITIDASTAIDYTDLLMVPAVSPFPNPHTLFVRTIDDDNNYSHTNIAGGITLGIGDHEKAGIGIYPNPVVNDLNIAIDGGDKCRLIIYDLNGKIMLDKNIPGSATVDMSHYPSGIYTAYFWKEFQHIHVVKLIKE